jgi:hypothetical protein
MPTESGDWRRLAEYMDRRRAELGMNWDDVAAAGGTSVATLRRVRRGATLTNDNIVAIERGLRWGSDSVRRILAGGEPTPLDGRQTAGAAARATRASIANATPEQIAATRQFIEETLGPDEADKFLRRAIELQRSTRDERATDQGGRATG